MSIERELIKSPVFDTYWKFAVERQNIFFARIQENVEPWTTDKILSEYKFTNAYRVADRVSQYLVKNIINNNVYDLNDQFFRIILYKLFNKVATWELLESQLGEISWSQYNYDLYEKPLSQAMKGGAAIYSAAYIMASGTGRFNVERKHQAHLKLLELMIEEDVPERLHNSSSMKDAFNILKSYPLIGDFLAYQLITDINYSEITDFSESEFTCAGPGAKDGITKCFPNIGKYSYEDVIKHMYEIQDVEFDKRDLNFQNLFGRKLQLIDIQNLFCEVDKYSRVKHPEISGLSGRSRIKQKYAKNHKPISYVFPNKWNLIYKT